MSCFNAERWLADSIESVLSQTWRDFEFILVDDGSKDATADIISHYRESDRRIVSISKPNTGLANSLNTGIACAQGAWIARLDADDLCEPNRLELQLHCASKQSNLAFIGTGLTLIDEQGIRMADHKYPTSHQGLLSHLQTARKFPAHSSAFIRTEAFRRVGGYRPQIRRAEDWDLWLRLSEVGELLSLSEPLVRIRKHGAQISHDEGGVRQKVDSHVAIVSYWLRRGGHPDPVDADNQRFELFRRWVQDRLDGEGVFEREALRSGIKQFAHESIFSSVVHAAGFIVSHPASLAALGLERFIGSSLPKRLAHEWVQSEANNRL